MKNEILKYHLDTAYDRYKMDGHFLDWENQPDVYKTYPIDKKIPLDETAFTRRNHIWDLFNTDFHSRLNQHNFTLILSRAVRRADF